MSKSLSQSTAREFIELARRVVGHIANGDIRPEPGAEKKIVDLRRKAEYALALAARRREVK